MTREQQQRTKIKICGLKRPEDITYVNEAKPDYCGFIIEFPKSSRNVTGDQVRTLTANGHYPGRRFRKRFPGKGRGTASRRNHPDCAASWAGR